VDFACLVVCSSTEECAAHEACNDGVCVPFASACNNGELCPDGWYCDGAACRHLAGLGSPCGDGIQCSSGFCADGICCNESCDGECQACTQALTGDHDGTCANIPAGNDPNSECGSARGCNGNGGCDNGLAQGAECSTDLACATEHCVDGVCCESACDNTCMACAFGDDDPTPGLCRNFAEGEDPDSECLAPFGCSGGPSCASGAIDGDSCLADNDCSSLHCVSNICCNSSCTGSCESCASADTGGSTGECLAIPEGFDPRNECDGAHVCSGNRSCQSLIGESCNETADCILGGNCISNVCSDTPVVPTPLQPTNGGYTGSVHVQNNLKPRFRWAAVAGGAQPITYTLQADDSCPVTGFQSCAFASPEITTSTTDTSYQPGTALPVSTVQPVGRRYFWRVKACDRVGTCSAWSAVRYVNVGREEKDFNGDGYADLLVGQRANRFYVHNGSANGVAEVASQTLVGPSNTNFASGLAAVGDVNADGYGDVVVGASAFTDDAEQAGRAYLYLGSGAGLVSSTSIRAPIRSYAFHFGDGVARVGDTNGDGFADVAVSAKGYSATKTSEGAVYVITGYANGLSEVPGATLTSPIPIPGGILGWSADGNLGIVGGDLDNDGCSDLVLPMRTTVASETASVSRVILFRGDAILMVRSEPEYLWDSPGIDVLGFGVNIAAPADFDGDGWADLAVGSALAEFGPGGKGGIRIFRGTVHGLEAAYVIGNPDNQTGLSGFSGVVRMSQRLTADGRADLVIAAPLYDAATVQDQGALYTYQGEELAAPLRAASPPHPDPHPTAILGFVTACIGDVNGDGFDDVAATTDYGSSVYVFNGGFNGLAASYVRKVTSTALGFGNIVD